MAVVAICVLAEMAALGFSRLDFLSRQVRVTLRT
jgi:hypothetical protein